MSAPAMPLLAADGSVLTVPLDLPIAWEGAMCGMDNNWDPYHPLRLTSPR